MMEKRPEEKPESKLWVCQACLQSIGWNFEVWDKLSYEKCELCQRETVCAALEPDRFKKLLRIQKKQAKK